MGLRCPGVVKQQKKQGKQINEYSQVPCSFKEYEIVGSPQSGASPALMFKWDVYDDIDDDHDGDDDNADERKII